jgi:hypothetical protein
MRTSPCLPHNKTTKKTEASGPHTPGPNTERAGPRPSGGELRTATASEENLLLLVGPGLVLDLGPLARIRSVVQGNPPSPSSYMSQEVASRACSCARTPCPPPGLRPGLGPGPTSLAIGANRCRPGVECPELLMATPPPRFGRAQPPPPPPPPMPSSRGDARAGRGPAQRLGLRPKLWVLGDSGCL